MTANRVVFVLDFDVTGDAPVDRARQAVVEAVRAAAAADPGITFRNGHIAISPTAEHWLAAIGCPEATP